MVFLLVTPYKTVVPNKEIFFTNLGQRLKKLRKERGHSQEDMISFGFSVRHWQMIEAGRPVTVTTLLRICESFEIRLEKLVAGLDKGIYETGK